MDTDRRPQCPICHDVARVPTRITCFPCVKPKRGPACNSLTRVCWTCARRFLELDRPKHQRSNESKRCLTCPAQVHTSLLDEEDALDVDYITMTRDDNIDYACPWNDACSFRGSQQALETHLLDACPSRPHTCPLCNEWMRCDQASQHVATCSACTTCVLCADRLPHIQVPQHMHDVHERTWCNQCCVWIPAVHMERHLAHECPQRLLTCPVCVTAVRAIEWVQHLATDEMNISRQMNHAMTRLQNCTQDLQRLHVAKLDAWRQSQQHDASDTPMLQVADC